MEHIFTTNFSQTKVKAYPSNGTNCQLTIIFQGNKFEVQICDGKPGKRIRCVGDQCCYGQNKSFGHTKSSDRSWVHAKGSRMFDSQMIARHIAKHHNNTNPRQELVTNTLSGIHITPSKTVTAAIHKSCLHLIGRAKIKW